MSSLAERTVAPLYPGAFNLVMATGIVSNGFFLLGHRNFSDALLVIGCAAFLVLLVALALRAVLFPRRLWADLVDPRLVFTFFTLVAASDVVGSGLHLRGHDGTATWLWLLALCAWVLLGYFGFSVLTFVNDAEGSEIVHGGWLIAVVGTESVAILGDLLAPRFGSARDATYVTVYALWGIGIVLYAIFIALFSHRIFFLRLGPDEAGPIFWVVMGAAAISTNAGSTLVDYPSALPFLERLRPFVDGTTFVLWAWGTWWIPLLVILGVWRHVVRRYPLRFEAAYWNLVFPLGMYTVATFRLSLASDFGSLRTVARVMIWVAFAAWLAPAGGLVSAARRTRPRRS